MRLLAFEECSGLMCDDGADEPLLVAKVVVELRGAYSGPLLYVLPAGACHAARIHQRRRDLDDPLASGSPLGRERSLIGTLCIATGHRHRLPALIPKLELTLQYTMPY